jgi:PKD repeat protein
VQHPSFTYTTPGTYSVKLTATNGVGSDDEIKTNYITVGEVVPTPPVANFSGTPTSGLAPLTVSFTDQSSGGPTGWAWDFDNNGTVDSTAQNPSFTYNTAGTYTVKLTATNGDGSDDEIKTNYISVSTGGGTATVTLLPNGDGTIDTVIKPSGTTSLFQAIDETLAATDDSTTYIRNNNATSGRSFALLTDTPANFGGMSALSVDVRARTVGRVDDTTTLYAQLYKADESTPLSDEVVVAINPGASGWTTLANITFTGVVPGTKADWDGARLRLRWAHSPAGSADATQIRVTVVEVDSTYVTAGP